MNIYLQRPDHNSHRKERDEMRQLFWIDRENKQCKSKGIATDLVLPSPLPGRHLSRRLVSPVCRLSASTVSLSLITTTALNPILLYVPQTKTLLMLLSHVIIKILGTHLHKTRIWGLIFFFFIADFQFLPKSARGLLGQKRDAIDNNYGR